MQNYKLPNRKRWLLTNEFLTTFKEELDKVFNIKTEDNPTYWNTYAWLDGTTGFYHALEMASKKHNVTKAIYEYAQKLPWYDSDCFDSELTIAMYKKGIVKGGSIDDIDDLYSDVDLRQMEKDGEIEWEEEIHTVSGGYVIRRDWKFIN